MQRSKSVSDLNRPPRPPMGRIASSPALRTKVGVHAPQRSGERGRVLYRGHSVGSLRLHEAEKEMRPLARSVSLGTLPKQRKEQEARASNSSPVGQSIGAQNQDALGKPSAENGAGHVASSRADGYNQYPDRHPGWDRLVTDIHTRITFSSKTVIKDGMEVEEPQYFNLRPRHYKEPPSRLLRWTLRNEVGERTKAWTPQQVMALRLLLPDVDHGAELTLWKLLDPEPALAALQNFQRFTVDTSRPAVNLKELSDEITTFLKEHAATSSGPGAPRLLVAHDLPNDGNKKLKIDHGGKVLHLGVNAPSGVRSSRFAKALSRSTERRKAREALKAIVAKVNAEVSSEAQGKELKGAVEGIEALLDAHVKNGAFEDIPFDKAHDALKALATAIHEHSLPKVPAATDESTPLSGKVSPDIPSPPSDLPPVMPGRLGGMTLISRETAQMRSSGIDHTVTAPGRRSKETSAADAASVPDGEKPLLNDPPQQPSNTLAPNPGDIAASKKRLDAAQLISDFQAALLRTKGKADLVATKAEDGYKVISENGEILYLHIEETSRHFLDWLSGQKRQRTLQARHALQLLLDNAQHSKLAERHHFAASRVAELKSVLAQSPARIKKFQVRSRELAREFLTFDVQDDAERMRNDRIGRMTEHIRQSGKSAADIGALVAVVAPPHQGEQHFHQRVVERFLARMDGKATVLDDVADRRAVQEDVLASKMLTLSKLGGELNTWLTSPSVDAKLYKAIAPWTVNVRTDDGMVQEPSAALKVMNRLASEAFMMPFKDLLNGFFERSLPDSSDKSFSDGAEGVRLYIATQVGKLQEVGRLLGDLEFVKKFPEKMRATLSRVAEAMLELANEMLEPDGPFVAAFLLADAAVKSPSIVRPHVQTPPPSDVPPAPNDIPPPPSDVPPAPNDIPPPPSDVPPAPNDIPPPPSDVPPAPNDIPPPPSDVPPAPNDIPPPSSDVLSTDLPQGAGSEGLGDRLTALPAVTELPQTDRSAVAALQPAGNARMVDPVG